MLLKVVKWSALGLGVIVAGAMIWHHTELGSYMRSSAHSVKDAMKDSVPIEFELRRAKDMVDEIVPEMQANIKRIAQEEVEIEHLRGDIRETEASIDEQKVRLSKLRRFMDTDRESFFVGTVSYSRSQVREDMATRLSQLKEAEMVLAGKKKLLEAREKSLAAAIQMLEKTKRQKATLESRIAALEAKHRMLQASAVGSDFKFDDSKLAQTEKLLRDIHKRLDVTERVMVHEGKFAETMLGEVQVVDEEELLSEVDEYLDADASGDESPTVAGEMSGTY